MLINLIYRFAGWTQQRAARARAWSWSRIIEREDAVVALRILD